MSNYFQSVLEAYQKMLQESPYYDRTLTRESSYYPGSFGTTEYRIKNDHSTATPCGNNFFHNIVRGDHHFYHINETDNDVDAISTIDPETKIQTHLFKHPDVPSTIVHQNFKNALGLYGTIKSDNIQSKGSRHFWFNFHKNFPEHRISMIDLNNNTTTQLHTHEDMMKHEKKIWDSHDSMNVMLQAHQNEK